MNNEQQCKCELDGFQGAIWKGDCPLHKDDDKFIPHTNNNWIEEFDKQFHIKLPIINTSSVKSFISNLLTKKDQEHKAELEMIKGEIEARLVFINKIDGGVVSELFAEAFNDGIKSTISILDSHINKPYEQQRHKTE